MKKFALLFCFLLIISGCREDKGIYPSRSKDTPYFYNDTSITEINQDVCLELRRARETTGVEFVTVLIKQIPDNISVEEYSAGLFHKWKIGSRTKGKGVLVLFVENTHTLKIEVSYNLEATLTDAFCSIFQPTIKSYYAGRYFGDVFSNVIRCMTRRITAGGDYNAEDFRRPVEENSFLSGGGGIVDDEYFYEKDAKLSFIHNIPEKKIRQFDSDRDIEVVITRYLQSLEEGINYPFLGLLTEGSQMKRLEYPESPHFYKSRWQDCQEALPYRIKFKGNLAALRFAKDQSFPIFLRRTSDGFWKVDAARAWVCSWQSFAKNESGPLYDDHPWIFAFPEYTQKNNRFSVPALLPASVSLKDEIKRLEYKIKTEPGNAENYFKLADILYWDCLWIGAAIDLVEKGLAIEPDNIPYRWLVIDMRYRFEDSQPNLDHFKMLMKINPKDLDTLHYYSRHCWYYTMELRKAVKLIEKAKKVERKLSNKTWKSRWYLITYKYNFWKQLFIDRNLLYRYFMYIYVFHWTQILYQIGASAVLLTAFFMFLRLKRRSARLSRCATSSP